MTKATFDKNVKEVASWTFKTDEITETPNQILFNFYYMKCNSN